MLHIDEKKPTSTRNVVWFSFVFFCHFTFVWKFELVFIWEVFVGWSGCQSMWVDFSLPSSGLRSPSAAPIASGEETGVESLTRFSSVQRRRYRQPRVVNPFALIESQCGSDTVIGSVCGCGDSAFANNQKKRKRVAHVVVCCHHLWYRRGQNRCSESAALG